MSTLASHSPTTRAAELAQRYAEVRRTTEALAAPLTAEDQMVQSMADASPTKWHRAHTAWFFETFLLIPHVENYGAFNAAFAYLFNSYYKQVGAHYERPRRGLLSRPSAEQVGEYRRYVDDHMARLLETELRPEIAAIVELGLNHEQQHQELILTDIKHAFWTNPLRPAYTERAQHPVAVAAPMEWAYFEGGLHAIGHDGPGFAFDNESPRHRLYLQPFQLGSRLVTNEEYLAFMDEGGYTRPELWLSEGWDAVNAQGWRAPFYWEEREGQWWQFTLSGMRPVEPSQPVCHVSYFEADAYARWAGARLPSEAEWEVAASQAAMKGNFVEEGNFHPAPAVRHGERVSQLFGDCWEWTSSAYSPYPGYRPAAGALGEYNGKFMCNQLVLRGGSCATPRWHLRPTYRNFFPPHARWQFSGIRLANDRQ